MIDSMKEAQVTALTERVYADLKIKYEQSVEKIEEDVRKKYGKQLQQDEALFKEKVKESELALKDIDMRMKKYGCESQVTFLTRNTIDPDYLLGRVVSSLVETEVKAAGLKKPDREKIKHGVVLKLMETESPQTIIDTVTKEFS